MFVRAQVLTVEEPHTTWVTETRTEWDTVIENVPCIDVVPDEDEIIVTTTRNGSLVHEEVQVR